MFRLDLTDRTKENGPNSRPFQLIEYKRTLLNDIMLEIEHTPTRSGFKKYINDKTDAEGAKNIILDSITNYVHFSIKDITDCTTESEKEKLIEKFYVFISNNIPHSESFIKAVDLNANIKKTDGLTLGDMTSERYISIDKYQINRNFSKVMELLFYGLKYIKPNKLNNDFTDENFSSLASEYLLLMILYYHFYKDQVKRGGETKFNGFKDLNIVFDKKITVSILKKLTDDYNIQTTTPFVKKIGDSLPDRGHNLYNNFLKGISLGARAMKSLDDEYFNHNDFIENPEILMSHYINVILEKMVTWPEMDLLYRKNKENKKELSLISTNDSTSLSISDKNEITSVKGLYEELGKIRGKFNKRFNLKFINQCSSVEEWQEKLPQDIGSEYDIKQFTMARINKELETVKMNEFSLLNNRNLNFYNTPTSKIKTLKSDYIEPYIKDYFKVKLLSIVSPKNKIVYKKLCDKKLNVYNTVNITLFGRINSLEDFVAYKFPLLSPVSFVVKPYYMKQLKENLDKLSKEDREFTKIEINNLIGDIVNDYSKVENISQVFNFIKTLLVNQILDSKYQETEREINIEDIHRIFTGTTINSYDTLIRTLVESIKNQRNELKTYSLFDAPLILNLSKLEVVNSGIQSFLIPTTEGYYLSLPFRNSKNGVVEVESKIDVYYNVMEDGKIKLKKLI